MKYAYMKQKKAYTKEEKKKEHTQKHTLKNQPRRKSSNLTERKKKIERTIKTSTATLEILDLCYNYAWGCM